MESQQREMADYKNVIAVLEEAVARAANQNKEMERKLLAISYLSGSTLSAQPIRPPTSSPINHQ